MEKQYDLEDMISQLVQLSDEQWSLYAFSREPLKGKLEKREKLQLSKKAIECGTREAEILKAQFQKDIASSYAHAQGVKVNYTEKANDGGYVVFAQYKPNKKEIAIFTHCIHQAKALMENHLSLPFGGEDTIREVLLSHEVFHHIEEEKRNTIFTRKRHVKLWSVGPIQNFSRLSCLSEIGGMYFAKELCQISWSPYLLDVFLVYSYSREAASNLFEGIMRVAVE